MPGPLPAPSPAKGQGDKSGPKPDQGRGKMTARTRTARFQGTALASATLFFSFQIIGLKENFMCHKNNVDMA